MQALAAGNAIVLAALWGNAAVKASEAEKARRPVPVPVPAVPKVVPKPKVVPVPKAAVEAVVVAPTVVSAAAVSGEGGSVAKYVFLLATGGAAAAVYVRTTDPETWAKIVAWLKKNVQGPAEYIFLRQEGSGGVLDPISNGISTAIGSLARFCTHSIRSRDGLAPPREVRIDWKRVGALGITGAAGASILVPDLQISARLNRAAFVAAGLGGAFVFRKEIVDALRLKDLPADWVKRLMLDSDWLTYQALSESLSNLFGSRSRPKAAPAPATRGGFQAPVNPHATASPERQKAEVRSPSKNTGDEDFVMCPSSNTVDAAASGAGSPRATAVGHGPTKLRANPNQDKYVGAVREGDDLEVLATQGEFIKVRTAAGKTGWIRSRHIQQAEASPPTSPALQPPRQSPRQQTPRQQQSPQSTPRQQQSTPRQQSPRP
eukprot:Hpha_TRINITY_DN16746_c3_g1::TRINITY_DN16746_c3_g1_i1::g.76748::m.76748